MFFKRNIINDIFHKKEYGIEELLELMDKADRHGGFGSSHVDSKIIADDLNVEFISTTIEPTWEFFEGACVVELNGEVIYGEDSRNVGAYKNEEYTYGKYKSREETARELLKMLENKDCVIENGKDKIKCIFVSDYQEENSENETEIYEDEETEM